MLSVMLFWLLFMIFSESLKAYHKNFINHGISNLVCKAKNYYNIILNYVNQINNMIF